MSEKFDLLDYPMVYILNQYWEKHGKKIKKGDIQSRLYNEISIYLSYVLDDQEDLKYLEYNLKIDKLGEKIVIEANNIVTALWFLNIFPINPSIVLNENRCVTEDGVATFDEKTKKIIWTKDE